MVITPEINHVGSITPHVSVTEIAPSQNVSVPKQTNTVNINITENKDNRFVATKEMEFVTKVKPGTPFVVKNKVGKIVLSPSQDEKCTVKAIIQSTAETNEKAQELVEQVSMRTNSSKENFYFEPSKKSGEDSWDNLSVDLYITAPANISIDISTDLGSIEITDLKTQIKAIANVGSIKTVNVVGQIQLTTNVGDIEFVAPHNFSAQLQANTKVGSIESEFPMDISKTGFTANKAQGTIGSGEKNVRLKTEVGTIRIKKSS
jgi:hypothetical protein